MKPNLFYSLSKYSATWDREPLEDYFTELVGFLFNFDKELASRWIKKISNGTVDPNPDTLKVFTQYPLGEFGRVDLAFLWGEHDKTESLLVEHKIESPVGVRQISEAQEVKTQIHNYLDYQAKRGGHEDHKVAFCKVSPLPTPLISDITQSPYFSGEFTWTDLFQCLDKFMTTEFKSPERSTTKFLCEQILEFMRRRNMIFENFTVHDLAFISPYNEFNNKLKKLVETIQSEFSQPL